MNILDKSLIKKSEESAVQNGVFSYLELMENAGSKAAEIINNTIDCRSKKVAVLCGKGNNGGDGFVIARKLFEYGAEVTVVTPFGKPCSNNAKYYYDRLELIEKTDTFCKDINYDIIIDSLFGIGFDRQPDDQTLCLFENINSHKAVKFSIDLPSGVSADSGRVYTTAVKADYTITFIALKPCFVLPDGLDYCGEVTVADIGVKPLGYTYKTTEKPVFKKRKVNSHKGDYGTALILCGSYGMAGASILATKAALKSGLGIAKCGLCESIYLPLTVACPEAVCLPMKQTRKGGLKNSKTDIQLLSQKCKAILFGCGVGKGKDIQKILKRLVLTSKLPLVIDADGINALSYSIDILKKTKAPIILTPHPAEMARLCGKTTAEVEKNRVKTASDFAKAYNCTVVLKGARTIIADKNGYVFFNLNGNSGMATGGSGDVLSGIIVSLLAQGLDPLSAAKAGVFLHGEAGDKAASKLGERGMLPSDIIAEL